MPIYEYECSCGKQFENMRPMSEYDLPSICPYCAKDADRIMSTFTSTESEYFTVTDGKGNVVSRKQVSKYSPAYSDPAAKPNNDNPQIDNGVVLDRHGGGVYYNRNRP